MALPFTVNYDTSSGLDYDESFSTLRAAMHRYNSLGSVPYKSLTYDRKDLGTVTLLDSTGTNNFRKYGFLPCDYN